jgi:mRNA interferase MazF
MEKGEHVKDFEKWSTLKQILDARPGMAFAYPREVWWCSLGANIGAEIDGKNDSFERPVLVVRVYNKETLLVVPVTTKEKNDRFHHKIDSGGKSSWASLTQIRVISNKRLLRKVDTITEEAFSSLKEALKKFT